MKNNDIVLQRSLIIKTSSYMHSRRQIQHYHIQYTHKVKERDLDKQRERENTNSQKVIERDIRTYRDTYAQRDM